ncbi:MAG: GGDEF domain-containing protein [Mariprofundales bacterium]|nr:GGDEF domain-containing protein [Mariprofundales bacterium]
MHDEVLTLVNHPEQHLFNHILKLADSVPDSMKQQKLLAQALEAASSLQQLLSEQSEQIRMLTRISTYDQLTGIMNRRGFETELNHVLERAQRYGEQGAVIYIDLDHFKPINDSYGHAAGDAVLSKVANVLESSIRGTDYVARLGGDEFVVLLVNATREQCARRAQLIEQKLNSATTTWMGHDIAIAASIGVRYYDNEHCDRGLLEQADKEMYAEKQRRHQEVASLTGFRERKLEAMGGA